MAGHAADKLLIWTVYNNPSDYPGKYVVRWFCLAGDGAYTAAQPTIITDTLEEARAALPQGLHRLGRGTNDDHTIVETWV